MINIHASTLEFLRELAIHNNRAWFEQHKSDYTAALYDVQAFVDALIREMNTHDVLEPTTGKDSVFRIYRDVRFSKDKTPYHTRFALGLQRLGKQRRGGYYLHLQPGNSYLACGFFGPEPADLKRIRDDIAVNHHQWRQLLELPGILKNFGTMQGEQLITVPRGFDPAHPAIDLLRHKAFIFRHEFTDKEVMASEFVHHVSERFRSIRPFFDYMSEVLTTNLNGESIL